MSEQLPDFTTAPAWLDVPVAGQMPRTADEWVQRIDRDALALEIALTPDPSHAGMGTRHVGMDWAREMADAVLAAMPDLMGGAS